MKKKMYTINDKGDIHHYIICALYSMLRIVYVAGVDAVSCNSDSKRLSFIAKCSHFIHISFGQFLCESCRTGKIHNANPLDFHIEFNIISLLMIHFDFPIIFFYVETVPVHCIRNSILYQLKGYHVIDLSLSLSAFSSFSWCIFYVLFSQYALVCLQFFNFRQLSIQHVIFYQPFAC